MNTSPARNTKVMNRFDLPSRLIGKLTNEEAVVGGIGNTNFDLWAAGHRHINTVTAFKSPDSNRPELGFWQVETASLRDFPQQLRIFELVRNQDATVSILATNVDPIVSEGSMAAKSRTNAVAAQQIFKNDLPFLPTGSYNAELVVQLSPQMQDKLKNVGTPVK